MSSAVRNSMHIDAFTIPSLVQEVAMLDKGYDSELQNYLENFFILCDMHITSSLHVE